jgi:hypothetical protein
MAFDWGQGCLEAAGPQSILAKGGTRQVKRFLKPFKQAIVGGMELVSVGTMIRAAAVLTPTGTLMILIGLLIGVVGLAIHDVWHV